ncbi:Fic family protein [Kineosporia sp. J2-2]|uniref:Fic family protein n=1 Tax=Kineosporia corallincola TaxID=2835133 RepID=A0ABS5TEP6_9ACTN|nr:Fic family protein [Kineosporia corallincola]MBT0769525.1 Fic family protein [Kineosporia corallincola]
MARGYAVGYEERAWESDAATIGSSRRARMSARGPYRAAVPSSTARREFSLPAGVEAAAADALAEIVRFDGELSAVALGHDGEFAPLATVLLRTESASSSQIENVTAGAEALAMATLNERSGPNTALVAANVAAMQRAVEMAEDLTEQTVLAAHGALLKGHAYAQPGRFRDGQVWIGGTLSSPHTASFVPPHAERVTGAMADLMAFCRRTDIPVLTHVAIAHAQFETIHPFADGNGRIGRVLVHVMLKQAGATRRLTVPVSAGLLVDPPAYFAALTAYRDGDAAPIVERFTEAAFAAVANGRALHQALAEQYAAWEGRIGARRDAAVWRVLPHLIGQPAITVGYVQEQVRVSAPAAQNAVDQLLAAGVVVPATANRRNRVWLAEGVIRALDDFAGRAGRRG